MAHCRPRTALLPPYPFRMPSAVQDAVGLVLPPGDAVLQRFDHVLSLPHTRVVEQRQQTLAIELWPQGQRIANIIDLYIYCMYVYNNYS